MHKAGANETMFRNWWVASVLCYQAAEPRAKRVLSSM